MGCFGLVYRKMVATVLWFVVLRVPACTTLLVSRFARVSVYIFLHVSMHVLSFVDYLFDCSRASVKILVVYLLRIFVPGALYVVLFNMLVFCFMFHVFPRPMGQLWFRSVPSHAFF